LTPAGSVPGRFIELTWRAGSTPGAPARYRRACRYRSFIPDELARLDPGIDATLSGMISEAEHAILALNAQREPALGPLARLLLRTESIASSKVEGMQLGVRELARAEARAESGTQPGATAVEILANIDAMVMAVDVAAAATAFGERELLAIHERLLKHTSQGHSAGRLRTQQNWIGGNDYNPCGADFVPPPVEEMRPLLDDLYQAINDDTISPLVQAALVHAQFETIHPFDDGNGRTGRALIHVVLRRRGLTPQLVPPVSVIFARRKARYIAGLTAFRVRSVSEWLGHFAAAAVQSARLAQGYVQAVSSLQERWREQLRRIQAPRADAAAWALIDALPAHPMISAPVAVAATGRARARIYEAIDQLVSSKVLIPLTTGKRNRWWEASGLLDLIADLEAGHEPAVTNE
jgi:Fic family protein